MAAIVKITNKTWSRSDNKLLLSQERSLRYVLAGLRNIPFNPISLDIAVLGNMDENQATAYHEMLERVMGCRVKIWVYGKDSKFVESTCVFKREDIRMLSDFKYDYVISFDTMERYHPVQQWHILWNSYRSLVPGGHAIHFVKSSRITESEDLLSDGRHPVPINRWVEGLWSSGVCTKKITVPSEDEDKVVALVQMHF